MIIKIKIDSNIKMLIAEQLAINIWNESLRTIIEKEKIEELKIFYPKHIQLIATSVIDEHLDQIAILYDQYKFMKIYIYVNNESDKDDFISCITDMYLENEILGKFEVLIND